MKAFSKQFISPAPDAGAAGEKILEYEEPQSVLLPLVVIDLIIVLVLLSYIPWNKMFWYQKIEGTT